MYSKSGRCHGSACVRWTELSDLDAGDNTVYILIYWYVFFGGAFPYGDRIDIHFWYTWTRFFCYLCKSCKYVIKSLFWKCLVLTFWCQNKGMMGCDCDFSTSQCEVLIWLWFDYFGPIGLSLINYSIDHWLWYLVSCVTKSPW